MQVDLHARSVKSRESVGDEALNWPHLMLLCPSLPSVWRSRVSLLCIPVSWCLVLVFSMCFIYSNVDRWLKLRTLKKESSHQIVPSFLLFLVMSCEGCDIVQSDHAPQAGVAQGIFNGDLIRRRMDIR